MLREEPALHHVSSKNPAKETGRNKYEISIYIYNINIYENKGGTYSLKNPCREGKCQKGPKLICLTL